MALKWGNPLNRDLKISSRRGGEEGGERGRGGRREGERGEENKLEKEIAASR